MIFNDKAYTFLELLFLCIVSSILSYILSTILSNHYSFIKKFQKQDIIRQILAENIVEVNGTRINELPKIDQCKVLLYDRKGTFLKFQVYSQSSAHCSPSPKENEIYVVWTISRPEIQGQTHKAINNSSLEFDKIYAYPQSLKLPSQNVTVKQIKIQSLTAQGDSFSNQSVVLFKN